MIMNYYANRFVLILPVILHCWCEILVVSISFLLCPIQRTISKSQRHKACLHRFSSSLTSPYSLNAATAITIKSILLIVLIRLRCIKQGLRSGLMLVMHYFTIHSSESNERGQTSSSSSPALLLDLALRTYIHTLFNVDIELES